MGLVAPLFGLLLVAVPAADAASLSVKARAAYDDVRLRDAAVLFRESADAASTDEEKATALLWAGVAAGQAGELAIARRAFDDALRVRCAAELPTTVSPKVQSVFVEALGVRWPGGCPPPDPPEATSPTTPSSTTTTTASTTKSTPATATTPSTTSTMPATPATTPAAATPPGTMSPLGLGLVGVGGVALGVAGGVALKGAADIATASDVRTPQVDAKARLDDGNLALGIAAVTTIVGALAVGAGVVVLGGAE